jgi:hypothetical protein
MLDGTISLQYHRQSPLKVFERTQSLIFSGSSRLVLALDHDVQRRYKLCSSFGLDIACEIKQNETRGDR